MKELLARVWGISGWIIIIIMFYVALPDKGVEIFMNNYNEFWIEFFMIQGIIIFLCYETVKYVREV